MVDGSGVSPRCFGVYIDIVELTLIMVLGSLTALAIVWSRWGINRKDAPFLASVAYHGRYMP
jgi:hypothetical protein